MAAQTVLVEQGFDVAGIDRDGARGRSLSVDASSSSCCSDATTRLACSPGRLAADGTSDCPQLKQHARAQIRPKNLNRVGLMGTIRMIEALKAVSDVRDRPGSTLPRYCDQYWSALMISPPARVTRAAINWTDATSLKKWTEPSTNRALAPPAWNE